MTEIRAAVATGSHLDALRALRDRLAEEIDTEPLARDVASLGRQLADVLDRIAKAEQAEPREEGTPLDELARRRSARGAGPEDRPADAGAGHPAQ